MTAFQDVSSILYVILSLINPLEPSGNYVYYLL
jgi:hypothetical protein